MLAPQRGLIAIAKSRSRTKTRVPGTVGISRCPGRMWIPHEKLIFPKTSNTASPPAEPWVYLRANYFAGFASTVHDSKYFDSIVCKPLNNPIISVNDFPEAIPLKLRHDPTAQRHVLKFFGRFDQRFYEAGCVCLGIFGNILMNGLQMEAGLLRPFYFSHCSTLLRNCSVVNNLPSSASLRPSRT